MNGLLVCAVAIVCCLCSDKTCLYSQSVFLILGVFPVFMDTGPISPALLPLMAKHPHRLPHRVTSIKAGRDAILQVLKDWRPWRQSSCRRQINGIDISSNRHRIKSAFAHDTILGARDGVFHMGNHTKRPGSWWINDLAASISLLESQTNVICLYSALILQKSKVIK